MTKLDYPPKTRAELEEEKQKLIKILEDATEAANKLTAKKKKNSGITPEKTTEVPPEKEETKESAEKTVESSSTPEAKEPEKTTEIQPEKETTPVTEETLSGKDAETLLKNIKRDDNKIQARIEGLISEGIDEKLAKEVAETEEVISACLARINILQKAPKAKDQERRLKSAQDKLDTEKTRMESLVKNMESLISDKKQKIKEKNEELEKVAKQLQEMITKLKDDGNSEEDIEKILKSKNIPEEEINKLLGREAPKPQVPEKEPETPKGSTPEPEKTDAEKAKTMSEGIKQQLENDKEKNIANIPIEQLLNNLNTKELSAKEKLNNSKEFGSRIIRGLDKWETYGQGEKGPKGFAKRMTKNAINLALVGVISSVAVDQLAEAGIGSATALGGGVFSYAGRKMAIGLGFGAAFDRVGNKLAENNNKKIVKGIQKAMPYLVGVGSIAAAYALSGGTVALASAGGIIVSKLFKGLFTKEKIEKRQERAKDKILAEIKSKGETINTKDAEKYELEMTKIIKKYEKQRIWGRLADAATRLTIASTVSAVVLEASGTVQDRLHHYNQSNTQENTNNNAQKTDEIKTDEKAPDNTNNTTPDNNQTPDNSTNHQNQDNNATSPTTDNTTPQTLDQNNIEIKEASVDFSSKGAIQTISDLREELNDKYNGDFSKAPSSVQDFMDPQNSPTELAIKLGFYDPNNPTESAMILKGSTLGFNGEGDLIMHDSGSGENHIVIDNETVDVLDKYNGKMFDSDHSATHTNHTEQTPHVSEDDDINTVPEQINPETGEKIDLDNVQETPHVEDNNTFKVPEQVDAKTDGLNNSSDNTIGGNTPGNTPDGEAQDSAEIIHNGLTQAEIDHAHSIFNNNIDHLFNERSNSAWEYIQKNVSAERIMEMYRVGEIKDDFIRLTEHMDNLERITGIHPQGPEYGLGGMIIKEAETIPHFIGRALEEAEKLGVIDKVTL